MVTSPNSEVSPSPAQPASNITGYIHEAQEGETTVAEIVARVTPLYGLGCSLFAVDAALVQEFRITASAEPV